MTNSDEYLITVYDTENDECFLIYKSTISPQLNTQLYFPHLGLYNVEKIVHHISDDHTVPEYEELMFIDVMVSKVNKEKKDNMVFYNEEGKATTAINLHGNNNSMENLKTNNDILKEVFNEHDYNILRDRMIGTLWWTNPYKEKKV